MNGARSQRSGLISAAPRHDQSEKQPYFLDFFFLRAFVFSWFKLQLPYHGRMKNQDTSTNPVVRLKIERRSNHPWIFQKMVDKPEPRPNPAASSTSIDRDGTWVGRGFYNGHSRIALRVLTADPDEAIDEAFFARKIAQAVRLRRETLKLDAVTDAYRVVHSEGDGLSGLVVDRFADTLVVEFFSAGMVKQRDVIKRCLLEHFPDAQTLRFAEEHVQKQEIFDLRASATPPPTVITEHGVKFRVAPGSKHKTGFFVDQRDNRKTLADFCAGKRVLDLCCNTGGFGVYAKTLGGADEVVGVDLDEEILADRQAEREPQQGPGALHPGRPLRLAARRAVNNRNAKTSASTS